jgi:hypothetical protein
MTAVNNPNFDGEFLPSTHYLWAKKSNFKPLEIQKTNP